ncbi:GAP family protein, partial [Nocardioides sp. P5_C9_2]
MLLQLVPLAIAAALSTVTITATIFILIAESRRRSGLAFAVGTVIGTFAAVAIATVASQALPGRPRHHDALVAKLLFTIGLAMVVLGVVTLARRHRPRPTQQPGWINGLASLGAVPVLGVGLALNLRPKSLLLAAAAGLAISGAHLHFDDVVVLTLFYTALATCTVVAPIVATMLLPGRLVP